MAESCGHESRLRVRMSCISVSLPYPPNNPGSLALGAAHATASFIDAFASHDSALHFVTPYKYHNAYGQFIGRHDIAYSCAYKVKLKTDTWFQIIPFHYASLITCVSKALFKLTRSNVVKFTTTTYILYPFQVDALKFKNEMRMLCNLSNNFEIRPSLVPICPTGSPRASVLNRIFLGRNKSSSPYYAWNSRNRISSRMA